MRRAVRAVLAVLTLAGIPAVGCAQRAGLADDSNEAQAPSQNKVQAPSQKTPREKVQAVVDEHQKARQNVSQADSKARTDGDPGIGRPCPEIAGADIDGQPFKLSDYKGKVVVVDFWGDW